MIEPFEEAEVQAARLATYPPPYPESWYVAARAADLTDEPRKVRVAGNSQFYPGPQDSAPLRIAR